MIDLYTTEQVDRVRLIYNHFKSPIEQTLMDVQILPIQPQEVYTEGRERPAVSYLYEPEDAEIFASPAAALRRDRHLPRAARVERERAGRAHERHAQRQRQRRRPDRRRYTLSMNRARQAAITQEILEVVAGAEALG